VAYTLEQVDLVRERMGVGYAEAREALEQAAGDVVGALAAIEQRPRDDSPAARFDEAINSIAEEVKQSLTGRLIKALRIKLDDQTVAEVPVTLVGVGAVLVTLVSAVLGHLRLETVSGDVADDNQPETT